MQSGQAEPRWILEFEPTAAMAPDPLMGWTSSPDTSRQVRLFFDTREDAMAYARRHGIPHQVMEPKPRDALVKSYADNFAFRRREPWSH